MCVQAFVQGVGFGLMLAALLVWHWEKNRK